MTLPPAGYLRCKAITEASGAVEVAVEVMTYRSEAKKKGNRISAIPRCF